jgi:hypothetical protein
MVSWQMKSGRWWANSSAWFWTRGKTCSKLDDGPCAKSAVLITRKSIALQAKDMFRIANTSSSKYRVAVAWLKDIAKLFALFKYASNIWAK